MTTRRDPSDFIVRLDAFQLDEPTKQRIEGAIQGAVLAELGKLDLRSKQQHKGVLVTNILHPEWRGLWPYFAKNLQDFERKANQRLDVQELVANPIG